MQDEIAQNTEKSMQKIETVLQIGGAIEGGLFAAAGSIIAALIMRDGPIKRKEKEMADQKDQKDKPEVYEGEVIDPSTLLEDKNFAPGSLLESRLLEDKTMTDMSHLLEGHEQEAVALLAAIHKKALDMKLDRNETKQYVTTELGKWYCDRFGSPVTEVDVPNDRVFEFERSMARTGLPYQMTPYIRPGEYKSVYFIASSDHDRVKDITSEIDHSTYLMPAKEANEFFYNDESKFVNRLYGLAPYGEGRAVMMSLNDKGIRSYIDRGDGQKPSIVFRTSDILNKKDLIKTSVLATAITARTKAHKKIIELTTGQIEALKTAYNIRERGIDSIKDKSFYIYDSACPDRYIKFQGGGAFVFENGVNTKTYDLSDIKDRNDLFTLVSSGYAMPVQLETGKDIKDISLNELTKPFAVKSMLFSKENAFDKVLEDKMLNEELLRSRKLDKQIDIGHSQTRDEISNPYVSVEAHNEHEDMKDSHDVYDVADIAQRYGEGDLLEIVNELETPDAQSALMAQAPEIKENIKSHEAQDLAPGQIAISEAEIYRPEVIKEPILGDFMQSLDKALQGQIQKLDAGNDREGIIDRNGDGIDDRDQDSDHDGVADAYDDHDDEDIDNDDFDPGFDASDFEDPSDF